MTRSLLLAVLSLSPAVLSAQTMTEVWRTGGFALPESAWYEASIDRIVVSNIGVFGPDGGMDGRMSLVTPDGTVETADWVTGLMDPKGMASANGMLYVADAVVLQVIDIAAGTLVETIALPDAVFPNDVTVGADGAVYVTEFITGGIWRVADGAVTWAVAPGGLPLPNGILADGDRLIAGSFGDALNPDFTVNVKGGLIAVDPATGAATPIAGTETTASVDGIVHVGDIIVYDDNTSGAVFAHSAAGTVEIGNVGPGAADMGVMDDIILIPLLNAGELVALRVE